MTNTNDTATTATNAAAGAANHAATAVPTGPSGWHHDTAVAHFYQFLFGEESSTLTRLLFIAGITVLLVLGVKAVKWLADWLIYKSHEKKNPFGRVTQQPKFITVTSLTVSGISFIIYFLAIGLILQEVFDVDLTTYLASASIIGLAISFGSQGLVQDIVSGMTLIFCDAMDVGDLVEIVGSATVSGRVEKIGLRYTILVNFINQRVMVPNRTIANVSRFAHGGVDAFGDVHIPAGLDPKKAAEMVAGLARGMKEQFGAIIFGDPTMEPMEVKPDGTANFYRVHFRIWPGQSALIETTFRSRVVAAMKVIDPNYSDWQVPVTYRSAGKKS